MSSFQPFLDTLSALQRPYELLKETSVILWADHLSDETKVSVLKLKLQDVAKQAGVIP